MTSKAERSFVSDLPNSASAVTSASADEEPHFEHTVMARETDGISFFIEAAARIGE
jgi:hypothetical protein